MGTNETSEVDHVSEQVTLHVLQPPSVSESEAEPEADEASGVSEAADEVANEVYEPADEVYDASDVASSDSISLTVAPKPWWRGENRCIDDFHSQSVSPETTIYMTMKAAKIDYSKR